MQDPILAAHDRAIFKRLIADIVIGGLKGAFWGFAIFGAYQAFHVLW